jgi:RAB protein geranylgeranyltransferase component A
MTHQGNDLKSITMADLFKIYGLDENTQSFIGHAYFPNKVKVKKAGRVNRVICILNHPIPNTNNESSLQIILPQRELKRKNDIYVMAISSEICDDPKGKYIANVSTNVENAEPEKEHLPGLNLLGPIEQKFVSIIDAYAPLQYTFENPQLCQTLEVADSLYHKQQFVVSFRLF